MRSSRSLVIPTDKIPGTCSAGVRWKEAVWVEKGKRKKKLIKVGERRVTAEVLGTDRKGFVCQSVCKYEILANLAARVE